MDSPNEGPMAVLRETLHLIYDKSGPGENQSLQSVNKPGSDSSIALCKGSIALWENIWCNSKYFSTKYLQNESLDDTGFHNLYFIKKLNVEKPLLSRFMQVQCKAHAHGRAEYTETRRQYIGHHTGSGCHIYSNSRSHIEACHDFLFLYELEEVRVTEQASITYMGVLLPSYKTLS